MTSCILYLCKLSQSFMFNLIFIPVNTDFNRSKCTNFEIKAKDQNLSNLSYKQNSRSTATSNIIRRNSKSLDNTVSYSFCPSLRRFLPVLFPMNEYIQKTGKIRVFSRHGCRLFGKRRRRRTDTEKRITQKGVETRWCTGHWALANSD